MNTPLAHLMSLTKSSAKEIAGQTGIDVTLLSKLKNGQRRLQYNSRYPALLADYFLQSRAEQSSHVVRDMLARRDGELTGAKREKLRDALALWLCSDLAEEAPRPAPAPAVQVIQKVPEVAPMLEKFAEMVLAAPLGEVIVVHDFPDLEMASSFLDFSRPWLERIHRKGNTIRILDCCGAPKTYMSIFNWLEFYFSDQVEFFANQEKSNLNRALFFMEDVGALLILSNEMGQKLYLCTLYSGKDGMEYFRNSVNMAMSHASRGIEKIPFNSIMDFLPAAAAADDAG